MGDVDQVVASGTFDLPTGKLFVARHVLFAVRTFKFEFAHRFATLYRVLVDLTSWIEQIAVR